MNMSTERTREVQFVKLSPTQNMTILVETPMDRSLYGRVGAAIMAYENVYAEQVGFLERPAGNAWARLHMSGGEFCGNATMSLAAWLAFQKGYREGEELKIPLEVSGAEEIMECGIRPAGSGYFGTVRMPLPKSMEEIRLPTGKTVKTFTAVHMPGITHIIAPLKDMGDDPRGMALENVQKWGEALEAPAFGIVLHDAEACRIEPLVCVRETGSLVWERGCGSGTAALGVYEALRTGKSAALRVAQPGGVIEVKADCRDGVIQNLQITGRVDIVARGTAFIPD
ncbi:MAG: hypothetical protein LBR61_02375 [Synergistaceae bacterium]|nr:hypothetical protein [Synergistaceae bacterium]